MARQTKNGKSNNGGPNRRGLSGLGEAKSNNNNINGESKISVFIYFLFMSVLDHICTSRIYILNYGREKH